MKCDFCSRDHDPIQPAFRRPDAIAELTPEERTFRARESDDLCALWSTVPEVPHRYFVRCVILVRLTDSLSPSCTSWGIWAEVQKPDFDFVRSTWEVEDAARLPTVSARLANQPPGYPRVDELPVRIQVQGPRERPQVLFEEGLTHPFASDCLEGVTYLKATSWVPHR